MDPRPDGVELLAPQIRRQRPLPVTAVAPAKGLPGEIVVVEAEAAGQPLHPGAQHRAHVATAGQSLVLRGRNAEPVERQPVGRRPTYRGLVEQRRHHGLETAPLLLERTRGYNVAPLNPVTPPARLPAP